MEVGTPYESNGNTGVYMVSLEEATTLDETGDTADCAPDTTTECSLYVGELKTGDIHDELDVDAWAVMLDGRSNYVIDVKGAGDKSGDDDNVGTLEDPFVYLLDPSGAQVAENDNVAVDNKNARIIYTVSKDAGGIYYIVVYPRSGTLDDGGTYNRTYTISVEDGAV